VRLSPAPRHLGQEEWEALALDGAPSLRALFFSRDAGEQAVQLL
jgi:hypothetical protein